jgi:aspartate-semialdehyde dehydrogenase
MKIAVIGATGAVGREIIKDLEDSDIKDIQLVALASPRSHGEVLSFRGQSITVKAYELELLKDCPYVLMSSGGSFSKEHSQKIAALGCVVIDNSSAWRMDANTPLIVPEVNAHELAHFKKGVIANPNCSTIQMVVALAPLEAHFGLEQVQVSTYQAVSGTGQKGIKELSDQMQAFYKFQECTPQVYEHPIAFNLIPYIGPIDSSTGYCEEELKMIYETRKIMNLPNLEVLPTTIRVPVFSCHSESVCVKLKRKVTRNEVIEVLSKGEGLHYVADEDRLSFPTPQHVAQHQGVYVSRVRMLQKAGQQQEGSEWVQFWNVADNLKKGAATNAVQIFEYLYRRA